MSQYHVLSDNILYADVTERNGMAGNGVQPLRTTTGKKQRSLFWSFGRFGSFRKIGFRMLTLSRQSGVRGAAD
jgi:hypothetical protein